WNHPTAHLLGKDDLVPTLHLLDQRVEQPETRTRVVMLSLVGEERAPCKEVTELFEPGVRFFRDITEILRVDGKWGVVCSREGCLMEGVNLALELCAIHWCRRKLLHQRAKHRLALLRGHGTVGVLEDLD